MLFLKSLEIQGFKSFPDKTRLEFNKELTAVVGPNGSGKSNISDAVRWVLGEQSTKTLRGARMEDVIFSGTKKRSAMGFAQVTLTIYNQDRRFPVDSDELVVSRKLYRSGDSEYRINGEPVRLRDVNELFMDTGLGRDGYSLIGQGKIAEIVSAKSSERREIFEEAAGISKFRYRKEEAERRLAQAEENLVRLRDILGELEQRVGPLKEQSEKAVQYLEFAAQRKTLELSLWIHKLSEIRTTLREMEDKVLIAQSDYERADREIEAVEERIAEIQVHVQQFLVEADQKRGEIARIQEQAGGLGAQIAVCRNDIEHQNRNIDRICQQKQQAQASIDSFQDVVHDRQAQKQDILVQIEQTKAEQDKLQEAFALLHEDSQKASEESDEVERQLDRLYAQRSDCQIASASAKANLIQVQQSLQTLVEQEAARESASQTLVEEKVEYDRLIVELADQIAQNENAEKGYRMLLDTRRESYKKLREEAATIEKELADKSRRVQILRDLEKNMEGFGSSVKAVIHSGRSGRIPGVLGTVAQLLKTQESYALAIETTLGMAMQNIVVENEEAAKRGIALLKEERAGRATFLPLTSVKGTVLDERGLDRYEGYIGAAYRLVEYDPRYDGVVRSLLGRVAVVDDIHTATQVAKAFGYKFRIVTLDGQLVNAGGSFTGGSAARGVGLLSRGNEIEKLTLQVQSLVGKAGQAKQRVAEGESQLRKLTADIEEVRQSSAVLQGDKIRFEAELSRVNALLSDAQKALSDARTASETLSAQQNSYQEEMTFRAQELEQVQEKIADLEKRRQALSGRQDDTTARRSGLSAQLSNCGIRLMELGKDLQAAELAISELLGSQDSAQEEIARYDAEIAALVAANEEKEAEIVQLEEAVSSGEGRIQSLNEEIQRILAQREQMEAQSTQLRSQTKETAALRERLSMELGRLQERQIAVQKDYDAIVAELWEQYQMTVSEAAEVARPVEDASAAQRRLSEVRGKIKALGNVNVGAVEEYKEVSARYDFMMGQVTDVESSKNELTRLIRDLVSDMERLFVDSFERINRFFGEIFVELFDGGNAYLELTDPENVLESGIEIHVAPPGKVIKNLMALSGGEQAFIAIAIYFAILRVRPAPFCILDEIEAALDDVNVVKYAGYLRNLTDQTQFILITHRRGTMEGADVLYGVTMQENGISRLLKLDVADADAATAV